jgi:peptide chain release factor subunit 1
MRHLGVDDHLATYGEQEVIQALKGMNVQLLLVSEDLRRTLIRLRCKDCGYVENRVVDSDKVADFEANLSQQKCLKCGGGNLEVLEKEDLIEALAKMAETSKANMELVSGNTEEGEMLSRAFGGIAAITNYRTY